MCNIVFIIEREVERLPPRWMKKITRKLTDADGKELATAKTVKELKEIAEEMVRVGCK